jgi:NTP pyrophosphatase (non-canonical NTP hydrolase)
MKKNNSIRQLQMAVENMIAEREWQPFQTPKNVSINIAVEAAELLEFFIWVEGEESFDIVKKNRQAIEHEIADIMISLLTFCSQTNIDLEKAAYTKLEEIKAKYPIDKVKGHHSAYFKLKRKKVVSS